MLDQRLQIKRREEKRKQNRKPPTLKQELNIASFVSKHRPVVLAGCTIKPQIGVPKKDKLPHPFRDLPEAEKKPRAIAMFQSGAWGYGAKAGRDLAKTFGVKNDVMAAWLGVEIWKQRDFDRLVVEKTGRHHRKPEK